MKKIVVELIIILLFISSSIYFHFNNKNIEKENKELYKYFNEKELLDKKSNINISEIKSKKNNLVEELKQSFSVEELELNHLTQKLEDIKINNNQQIEDINSLSMQANNLSTKVNDLQNQYNILNNKYNSMLKEKQRGTTYLIQNFPTINQYPNYPTGCESVAITILLRYYSINVIPDDIIKNLKKGELPHLEGETRYGGNPELEFVGDPYLKTGFGTYEHPIAEVANIYKQNINIKSNFQFNEVLNLVKNNIPVVVWTSMNLATPYISTSWIYKPTNETISWKANEHAVVVIGYNNEEVIISDPIDGKIKYQSRITFTSRYDYYGRKALYYA